MKTIKNRNTSGRPTKEPAEKKGYKITIKMATEEYYSLKAKARDAGVNRSEFIRVSIRSCKVKQRLTTELVNYIRQLCGMANNINQVAHRANAAGYSDVHNQCLSLNERLDNVIKKIEDDC
jgi:hypothetical protein